MKKFCADLRKYIAETINCEKKKCCHWQDKIKSDNDKKYFNICKKKFHDVDESSDSDDSNDDNDDDSNNGEEFDERIFHGDDAESNDDADCY